MSHDMQKTNRWRLFTRLAGRMDRAAQCRRPDTDTGALSAASPVMSAAPAADLRHRLL